MLQGEGENGPAFWPEHHCCRLYLSFPKSPIPQQARSERDGSFAVLALSSGLKNFYGAAIQKDLIPTREGSGGEIGKERLFHDHGPNHINGQVRMSVKQRLHTHPRISLQARKHLCLLPCFNVKRFDPKILEQLQILDVQGMILGRAAHPVGKAKQLRRLFAWRTLPPA